MTIFTDTGQGADKNWEELHPLSGFTAVLSSVRKKSLGQSFRQAESFTIQERQIRKADFFVKQKR